MGATVGSLFDTQKLRIEEVLSKDVEIFLPEIDPMWKNTILTSQGVGSPDELGRHYQIIKTYQGGFTGVVRGGAANDDFTLYGDNQNTGLGAKLYNQGADRTFPNPFEGPNQKPYQMACHLRSMETNLAMSLAETQAEATPAFIGSHVAPKLKGFARNIAHTLATSFWVSQNNDYRLGTIGAGGSGTAFGFEDGNTTLWVDMTLRGNNEHRFEVGQAVQIVDDSTASNDLFAVSGVNVFIVTKADPLTGRIWFKLTSNAAINGLAFAENDYFIIAGTKATADTPFSGGAGAFTGIAGINSFLKFGTGNDDNYLLGSERDTTEGRFIDVNEHPEFKSMLYSLDGQVLTEQKLRQILRRFHSAKGKIGQSIDCLFASDGVWLAYAGARIGREYVDRTGRVADALSNQGGEGGELNFNFDGRSYMGYTCPLVEANTIYGIKKGGNNWKRYTPPSPKGTQRSSDVMAGIPFEFVGSALTGTSSNFMPVMETNSSNITLPTDSVQAPGMVRMQLLPEQPAGLKITNVAEDRVYSSSNNNDVDSSI